jgi:RNA polymerase sigma factor (TIGR02999 family)
MDETRRDATGEVTRLLRLYREGDRSALDRLVPLVYDDLRRIARSRQARDRAATLAPTAVVHEAWLKLARQEGADWRDRGHFLAVAATAMRQVAIDYARRRRASKRGHGAAHEALDESAAVAQDAEYLLALERGRLRLAAHSPRLAQTFECRFFAGLSEEETAAALGVSLRTTQRDWLRARAWLKEELYGNPAASTPEASEG